MALRNREKLGTTWTKERALAQWQAMADVYAGAGVRVHLVDADPGPDALRLHPRLDVHDAVGPVVAAIQTEARRRDYAVIARTYERLGVPIWNWVTAGYFEGGDFGIIEPGKALLGYAGDRSTKEGAEQVQGWMQAQGWEAMTVPLAPQFVHLDAVVVMLADKLALVCDDALERVRAGLVRRERHPPHPGHLPRVRQPRRQPRVARRRPDPVDGREHRPSTPGSGPRASRCSRSSTTRWRCAAAACTARATSCAASPPERFT